MVDQVAKSLARPVRVWVLDATPGKARAGGDRDDHPAELISFFGSFPNKGIFSPSGDAESFSCKLGRRTSCSAS
ncbi:hypothetical protein OROHE_007303 [Orobanche hederae]